MENIFDFKLLISRCEETHQLTCTTAARATNKALVIRDFLLGRYIVEFEQNGSNRAQYGESLLQELSNALKTSIGRGFSVDNLESMRRFYTAYSANILPIKSETPSRISSQTAPILQTPSVKSSRAPAVAVCFSHRPFVACRFSKRSIAMRRAPAVAVRRFVRQSPTGVGGSRRPVSKPQRKEAHA